MSEENTPVNPSTGRRDGMLDIATDKPVVPLFRQRSELAEMVISVCGLIALASPFVLWISWNKTVFYTALGLGLSCIAICWLVVHFSDAD